MIRRWLDRYGDWTQNHFLQIDIAGRTLRAWLKPRGKAYGWKQWGVVAFGAGPLGFNYWSKRCGKEERRIGSAAGR